MKLFRVTLSGRLSGDSGAVDDAARQAVMAAMEELNKLGEGNAAAILNSSTGQIRISCAVKADAKMPALGIASDNIRLALQVGEIGTPDWSNGDHRSWKVEVINVWADELAHAA